MELRISGADTGVCASSYLSVSRSRLLALSASAAFMLFPGEMVRAQEGATGVTDKRTEGSHKAGTNSEASAAAPGPDPEGTTDEFPIETSVPPVVIEQQADPEPAAPAVAAEPDPDLTPYSRAEPRRRASAAQPAPSTTAAPSSTADGGFASQEAIEEAIFDLPVDGDTLNRGSSGVDGYYAAGTSSATKTSTLIMNIPGTVSIIPEELAEDQGANTLGQALLYVPGIAVQQGEGHRDQLTFRGQETTADFFVDGVRDDIETFRDLYNVQTIEVLKGPNAMIFGRGGGGGVINRVTKRADGIPIYEATLQLGSWGRERGTADVGQAISPNAAFRLNAMYRDV
jgi:catecholate siderophore receptor